MEGKPWRVGRQDRIDRSGEAMLPATSPRGGHCQGLSESRKPNPRLLSSAWNTTVAEQPNSAALVPGFPRDRECADEITVLPLLALVVQCGSTHVSHSSFLFFLSFFWNPNSSQFSAIWKTKGPSLKKGKQRDLQQNSRLVKKKKTGAFGSLLRAGLEPECRFGEISGWLEIGSSSNRARARDARLARAQWGYAKISQIQPRWLFWPRPWPDFTAVPPLRLRYSPSPARTRTLVLYPAGHRSGGGELCKKRYLLFFVFIIICVTVRAAGSD